MSEPPASAFSRRSQFELRKNRLQLAREAAAPRGLLDLTEGNPTHAGLPVFDRALNALADPRGRWYDPEPFGLLSAREAIAAYMARHGPSVSAGRIVLTASTSEAYGFLFKLLCDPGDEVLVPAPSYPLFHDLAQLEHVRITHYPLRYDGHWHVPTAELRAACSRRTRAVCTVHPNNPTGSFLKRDELRALASLGVPIISDEVFAAYPLQADPERCASALDCQDGLVFTLQGLSKLAALPQLKLAWICVAGRESAAREACARLELIADTYLSVGTPIQLALPAILEGHAGVSAAISARTASNLGALQALTQSSPISPLRVEGGWYAVLRLPALCDDESWAVQLLERAGVLVQPGYFYDFEAGPFIVVSLLTDPQTFERGIRRIVACCDGTP